MATPQFRGLNRLDEMQRRPFGTSAATRPTSAEGMVSSAAGGQYRQRAEAYNTATRLLRRQARRGDAKSALALLDVGREAAEEGFAPGGIRRRDAFNRGLMGSIEAKTRKAWDMERGQAANRRLVDDVLNEPRSPQPAERPPVESYDTEPVTDGGEADAAITPAAPSAVRSSDSPFRRRDLTLADVSRDLDRSEPGTINGESADVWTRRRKRLFDRSPY